ncbi:MAG TPA: hypothetical protein VJR06_09215 [Nitrososphaerales archaeon]|nr:hypothetical protein [Nitrososphaerales archaeon]
MPTISVRLTEEERRSLLTYGPLSSTVREALEMYVKERRRLEAVDELERYQKQHPVHVSVDDIVKAIREGRNH